MFVSKKKYNQLKKERDHIWRNSLCNMSDKECEAYKKFYDKHWNKHMKEKYGKEYKKVFMKNPLPGWNHVVELVGTGFSTCITVVCPICGKKKDITDIDNW